ncbi:hypothetical protein [Corallococcus macrosporus]|uniref:Outer membrane protein beta-barrel domain-containing protein n=1 Tax=Myxococcus fulvus (strain ATCC BAA-855 / HW-1) TaxID=483219 RepID=F8CDD5_MYXFH|nr:hypothetical protein [Corallococcus macrosporus]AEI67242.1 hypothetical protein LILAB_26750 [Corallococcus macrosporus]
MRLRALPLLLTVLATPVAGTAAPVPDDSGVSWSPERIVLGADTLVELKLQVPAGTGPLHAAASTGAFVADRVEGGAVRLFQWRPPSVRYPLVAVLLFWAAAPGPDSPPQVTVVRLPLVGLTELDVATAAGANVEVEVADRRFGPVKANGRGRARVPVEVPPGVRKARVLAMRGTLRTDATVPLDPPPGSPLAAVLTPSPLPPSAGGWLLMAGEAPLRGGDLDVEVEGAVVVAQDARTTSHLTPQAPAAGADASAAIRARPGTSTPGDLQAAITRHGDTSMAAPGKAPASASRRARDANHASSAEPHDVVRMRVIPVAGAERVRVSVRRRDNPPASRADAEVTMVSTPVAAHPSDMDASWRSSFFLLAGGVFAGGSNTGISGGVGVSVLTPLWRQRLAAELEVGARSSTLSDAVGSFRSQVFALPLLVSVRAELFRRAAFSLHGRAGAGPVPVHHYLLPSDVQGEVKESKVSGMGFVALQASHRFGRWSALAEARGAWAPVHTPWLDTQLGGLAMYLGMKFEP